MLDRIEPQFGENAQKVLCKRYLRRLDSNRDPCPHCGVYHETPAEMIDRVTFGNDHYYNLLASLDFLPGSPTLFNVGTGTGTSSSCFKFDVADSMESIMDVARKAAFVLKWGGGTGYVLSALRPEGAPIATTHGKACGPIAVLRLYHAIAQMVTQGGKRAGAQMAVLHCEHPDVEKFIRCKADSQDALTTFNISVACTNDFMEAAARYYHNREAPVPREYDLLAQMADNAWKYGDPGCFFIDAAEASNPTPWLGQLTGTNPCGEVPLLDNEPCNLGSINLSHMLEYYTDGTVRGFDVTKLEDTARLAVRYLDKVLDLNLFPDPVITEAALCTRKLGLGVMGWADALAMLQMSYASEDALVVADVVMQTIQKAAHDESVKLGAEKGCYPAYIGTSGEGLRAERRNAALTCIAPSGSISVLAGCSSGIEPHFTLDGYRALGDGTRLEEKPQVDFGEYRPLTALEIPWEWHIRHQAMFQKHTDLAVSKTVNLPEDATEADVLGAYIMAWESGCKGVTVYRNMSRDRQVIVGADELDHLHGHVLSPASVMASSEISRNGRRKMPIDATSIRHKFSVSGMEGYLHVGLYPDGSPGEVFITGTKQGSTINGLMDAVAVLTSIALQYGVPVESLVNKMRGTRFEPSGFTENQDIPNASSVLDYIYRFLGRRFIETDGKLEQLNSGMLCPDCGAEAVLQEGCLTCSRGCGWSRC